MRALREEWGKEPGCGAGATNGRRAERANLNLRCGVGSATSRLVGTEDARTGDMSVSIKDVNRPANPETHTQTQVQRASHFADRLGVALTGRMGRERVSKGERNSTGLDAGKDKRVGRHIQAWGWDGLRGWGGGRGIGWR